MDGDNLRASLLADLDDLPGWAAYCDWLLDNDAAAEPPLREWLAEEKADPLTLPLALGPSAGESACGPHVAFCAAAYNARSPRRDAAIERVVRDHEFDLLDDEEVTEAVAETNADGYSLSGVVVVSAAWAGDRWRAEVSFVFEGQQRDGRAYAGTVVEGQAEATIEEGEELTFVDVYAHVRSYSGGASPDE